MGFFFATNRRESQSYFSLETENRKGRDSFGQTQTLDQVGVNIPLKYLI